MFSILLFLSKKEKLASLRVSSSFYCLRPPAAHSPFDHSQHMPPTLLFSTPNEQTGWDIHGSETKSTLGLSIERLNNKKINLEQKAQEFKKQAGSTSVKERRRRRRNVGKNGRLCLGNGSSFPFLFFFLLVWDVFLKASIVFPISSFLIVVVVIIVSCLGCVLATKGRRWCKERESGLFSLFCYVIVLHYFYLICCYHLLFSVCFYRAFVFFVCCSVKIFCPL